MDRDVASKAHTTASTGAAVRPSRTTAGRWLQSLLVLWLLLGVSVPAWAACTSPQTATVASGDSVVFDCADRLGLYKPAITEPSHGSLDWGNDDSVHNLIYTNNGDGAPWDTFVAEDKETNDYITFNITVLPPTGLVVSPADLPMPTIGVAYSVQMSTSGGTGPYSYSIAGGEFPPGLSLSASGLVSGTPTQSGTHSFTVNVSDASAVTASKSYSVNIPAPALDMSPDSAVTGFETVAYNLVFSGSGGTSPYVFTVDGGLGPLPQGLSLDTSGAITGTPAAGSAGSYPVRIVMADNTTKSTSADTHSMAQDFTFVIQSAPTIAVGPTALTGVTVGAAYSQALSASGGSAPYSFAVTSGTLPAGLILAADGSLTGTPTAGGNFNFTVTATDSNGFSGDRAYNPTVATAVIALSPGLAATNVGVTYAGSITASGGTAPYSYAVTAGALPPGLTLDAATGAITGTATAASSGPGDFAFTVAATDDSTGSGPYTGSLSYVLAVYTPIFTVNPGSLPDGLVGAAYSQAITTSGGTAPYSYGLNSGSTLPTGMSLSSGGVLSGTPTAAGTFNFIIDVTDSSGGGGGVGPFTQPQPYSLTIASAVPVAGDVSATVAYGSGANPITLDLTGVADSVAVATPAAHGTAIASGTAIAYQPAAGYAGPDSFTYTATNTDGTSAPATVSITVAAPALVLSPAAGTLNADYGAAFNQTFSANGGAAPYSYAVSAGTLPAGLALDAASGVVTGMPTAPGSYPVTITATDSSSGAGTPFSVANSYTFDVGAPIITLAPAMLPDGTSGSAYSQAITASGGQGPYAFAVTAGALPPGLGMASDGTVAGTPTASGVFNLTVTAADANGQTGSRAYTLTIAAATLSVTPATLSAGAIGVGYLQSFSTSGGVAPYHYALGGGVLPPGMSLAPGGVLSGTPAATGTFAFDLQVSDSSSGTPATVTVSYVIAIDAPPTANAVSATVGYGSGATPITLDITGSGSAVTSVAVASAPSHGSASVSGLSISYQPNAGYAGADSFTYIASNAAGDSVPATVTITVDLPPLALTPAAGTLVPGYGEAYSETFSANGGAAPYAYALTGALPAGLVFDAASGTLSGTATETGSFAISVTASDSSTGAAAPFTVTANYDVQVASPAITITPATLADGTAGSAYSQTIAASGGVAPYTFDLASGTLPTGLQLASDGTLSGTPAASGTFNATVTATDANGQIGAHAYTLTIAVATLGVTPAAVPAGTVGMAYSQAFSASGGVAPYSYALGSGALPSGVTLDAGGVLSGTPTASGSFMFDLQVTDSSGGTPATATVSYTIAIDVPTITLTPATLPGGTVNSAYSQSLGANGGIAPYVFVISGGSLPAGMSLDADGLLSGTPTETGGFTFAVTATDSSSGSGPYSGTGNYTLAIADVAPTANDVAATVAYGSAATPVALDISGTAATSVAVLGAPSHGVATASGLSISYQPTAGYAGADSFTYTATNAAGTSAPATVSITVGTPTLVLTPPAGTLAPDYGVAFSQTFSASGGVAPYTYALTGTLPAGLALDTASGTLSGTATETGSFAISVTASDSSTGAAAPFTVTANYDVQVASPAITITPATLADGTAGSAYSQTIAASGGVAPYTFDLASGTLPAGLQLASDGTLSGTPAVSGTFNATVTATDANGQIGAHAYTLTVAVATLGVTPAAVPAGTVGMAYSQVFSASGGVAPYSYALGSGALPSGVTLDAGGVLSGTPMASGSFMFDLQVTDSSGGMPATETTSYTLVIGAPTVTLTPTTLPDGIVRSAYSQVLGASGGIAPYAFVISGGALPAGMSIAGDGTLSGTPTEFGDFTFAVTATDSSTGGGPYSATGNYTLAIADVAPTANDVAATVAYGSDPAPVTLDIRGSTATSVVVASAPAHGVATANGLSIDYQPTAGYTGTDSFTYVARNAVGDSAPATVTITVDPPTLALTPAAGKLAPDYGVAYSQAFNASGGAAPYAYVLTGALPAGLVFDAASGTLTGTAAETGNFPITVTATDSSTGTAAPFTVTASYDVQVATPAITITPATLADGIAGSVYSQALAASGGVAPYTFDLTTGTLPTGLQLAADGTLSGTPTASGTFNVTLQATDAHGQVGDSDYTLVIAEAPPVAVDDQADTLAGQAVSIAVTGNDSGIIDVIAVDAAPGHGSVRVEGLDAVYTPAAGFFGSDSFRYTASGPGGTSAAATVTIEVAPLPVPSGQSQSLTTLAGETVQFDAATGATGGPFTGIAIVEAPAEGEVVIDGTRIGYTPLATADGAVEIRYTLANAYGVSEPITSTITVNPRPVAATHQANTLSGGEVSVELTDNARGGPFTGAELLSVSPAEAGDASITATGEGDSAGYRLDFSAAADYAGTATVRYTLSNAYAMSAAATVNIEIAPRADPTTDAEVTGLLRAQVASVRRLARGQLGNFQRRMEQLHSGAAVTNGFDNNLSVATNRHCDERDWQLVGSACPRLLHDENAPVIEPAASTHANVNVNAPTPQFGIWTAGAMSFGDYDARRGASGFEFETQGLSLGADRHFSPDFALGAGLGYGRDVSDVGENGSRSEAKAWSAAVYASYHPGEHMYLDALLGRQWLSLQLRRHVTANGGQVQGSRDGHQWLASVTGGYQWQYDQLGMTAYARVDAARAQLDGYVEQGDPVQALAFDAQDIDTTITSLGWRMDYRREFAWGSFTPEFRFEYQHDLDADSVATMRYADLLDGPFYRTDVDGFDRNRFVIGLGAGWLTDRQLGLRLEYRSVLGDSGVDDQSLLLQVEKKY